MSENKKLERPWVTPEEVRDYSEFESVQKRTDKKLAIDISRAEQYVIDYTHTRFEDYFTGKIFSADQCLCLGSALTVHPLTGFR